MTLIVKRALRESWRDAVTARGGAPAALRFDALLCEGRAEAEAAYRTLEAMGLLWSVDEPGPETPSRMPGDQPPAL